MLCPLGKAAGPDTSNSSLVIVVVAVIIIALVCAIAGIPVMAARRRRLKETEGVAALMVVWGLILAGSAIYAVNAQMAYSREYAMRIMQNYDPADQSDRPAYPWMAWGILASIYCGALVLSITCKPPPPPPRGFDAIISPPRAPRD